MDNQKHIKPLPEKVVRRHYEILCELLPDLTRLVMEEGRPADTLLNRHLRIHRELGSRDRRFLSQAIFSYFRWYGWTVQQLGLPAVEACLVGVALDTAEISQSFRFIETHCKLPCAVEALGERSPEKKRDALNQWFEGRKGFKPLKLADLVLRDFGSVVDPEQAEACIAEYQSRPPAWIRARGEAAELMKSMEENQVAGSLQGHVEAAISVEGGVSLAHALSAQAAQFVIQDVASQCVGLICDPQTGGDWWDCCAGSGGKSLHLMDLMQNEGKVLATDIRVPALKELKKRARKYGIKNIRTQTFNAVNDEPFRKVFDGVLVDAPCSGWGTWSRNPDARWRTSRRDVVQCASRQLKILNNAVWCVKPGGTLIYAVCTITQPETEEVIMNFLEQHTNFSLDPFANPLNGEQTNGALQIWPWEAPGDGMFIARFIRDPE